MGKNNGQYVKLMEEVIWQGNKCIYYFDEKGEWSRQCEKAEENIKEQLTLEQTLEKCDNKQDSYAKVACYENLAMEFGDPSYCSKWIELMEDNLNEQWCIEAVTRINNKINLISDGSNPNICEEGLSEDERNYCYLRVSRELKDPSICDHIDDVYFQGKC